MLAGRLAATGRLRFDALILPASATSNATGPSASGPLKDIAMKLRSLALAGAMALACALPAAAQTSATLPVKDNSGTVRQIAGQQDAASAFHYRDIMEGLTSSGAPDPLLTDGSGHVLTVLFGTPTVNIGSIGGGATSTAQATGNSTLASILTALTPSGGLPVAGPLTAAQLAAAGLATSAGQGGAQTSLATIAANTIPAGVGAMASVPAASTNGTALGALPAAGKGARFYLGASDSVTFTVATAAPGAAPTVTYTISGASGGTGPNWDENLSGGAMVYVTATTGSPKFRWF